jgi:uncharacterized protein YqgC (DUF456 family)
VDVTTVLDLLAVALFVIGMVGGLFPVLGFWALCWGAVVLVATSYLIDKRRGEA